MNGQTAIGKYTIVRKLGEGGMGEVYEARHTGTGRRVALKVITGIHARNESLIARFELEARAAGTIESEHIVAVLDVGRDEVTGAPFLVMEYLVGEDVQHLCERVGPVAPDLALRVGAQALLGLAKAHAQGIVHRDIKPANLFLTERDGGELRVKVLDFGIAKVTAGELESGEKKRPITRTGSFVGSPLYMSPEQTRGKAVVDHRSDLWSLGIVLYQMIAGRTPFDHIESLGDFIVAVRSAPVDPIRLHAPWVDPVVARAIERALVIDQAARYQSADEMRAALTAFLPQGTSITAAMLVPTRPHEGPPTATVLGGGTAMAATTPGTPFGVPTPGTPLISVHSNPVSYPAGLSSQGTPALSSQGTPALSSQGTPVLSSQGTPAPSAPVLAAHGTIALANPATPVPSTGSGGAPPSGAAAAPVWPGPPGPPAAAPLQPVPPQPGRGGAGAGAALLAGGLMLLVVGGGIFVIRAILQHKHGGHGALPSGATSASSTAAPGAAPVPGADGGALPAELAPLVGTWRSEAGVQYDAVAVGDALRFRIHEVTPLLAAAGYDDGDVQFTLRASPGAASTFHVVDARIRPQPPAGMSYDRVHARQTCVWLGSEVEGEPLRAELQGERLQVELVRVDPPASAFVREGTGARIQRCSGIAQETVVPVELWLSRGAAPAAPRSAGAAGAGFWSKCSADAQCASHNCTGERCRLTGFEARCHADANCAAHRCVNNHCL